MSNEELVSLSSVELRRRIGTKEISPVELLNACLDRIEEVNPAVNAVTAMSVKRARQEAKAAETAVRQGEDAEKKVVSGAIRTDLILSAEIMIISLGEVAEQSVWMQAVVLFVVGILITLVVYGVVALIVKMDDIGFALAKRDSAGVKKLGQGLVKAMPFILSALSVVGTFAMTWVGGHIIVEGIGDLGWHGPHDLIAAIAHPVAGLAGVGDALAWCVETLCAFIVGTVWGAFLATVIHLLPFGSHEEPEATH